MRGPPSRLLPLLRSATTGELLAWLFLHPEAEYSATDLARLLQVSQSTVSREADRLADAGLIIQRRHGNLRLIRANLESAVAKPLADLLAVAYGPAAVLPPLLAPVQGIEEAYIHGSWAARYMNEPGAVPRDIDVLIVGDADENELFDAAKAAEAILGREVNISRIPVHTWNTDHSNSFLKSLLSKPLVRLIMEQTTQ